MEPLVKLSLARNNMQYFVATYMYLDLPWEKPDTTTLSFLLQLIGYTANVNRQTTDKLLFSYASITGENV